MRSDGQPLPKLHANKKLLQVVLRLNVVLLCLSKTGEIHYVYS